MPRVSRGKIAPCDTHSGWGDGWGDAGGFGFDFHNGGGEGWGDGSAFGLGPIYGFDNGQSQCECFVVFKELECRK